VVVVVGIERKEAESSGRWVKEPSKKKNIPPPTSSSSSSSSWLLLCVHDKFTLPRRAGRQFCIVHRPQRTNSFSAPVVANQLSIISQDIQIHSTPIVWFLFFFASLVK
jgi:hypothetical protein